MLSRLNLVIEREGGEKMAKKTLFVGMLMVLFSAIPGIAETNWELQSVDENGVPNYYKVGADPTPENLVVIEGICLNNPEDMLDPAKMWQIFVQGEGDDLGGTAAWAGKWYQSDVWEDELARLNSSGFREGDRVRITGYAMAVGGKANINERHSADPSMNFTVELLERGVGLPEPELVTIPEMNTFDPTRLTGGERYQCRRIRINDVHIVSGTWGKNQRLTIADKQGNTILMKLCNVDFGPEPTGEFDVIGLGNQEPQFGPSGPIPGTGLTDGYQIWVTRPDDIIIPEPVSLTLLLIGGGFILSVRKR